MNSFLNLIGGLFNKQQPAQQQKAQTSTVGGLTFNASHAPQVSFGQAPALNLSHALNSGGLNLAVQGAATAQPQPQSSPTSGASAAPSSNLSQDIINRQRQDELNRANTGYDQYASSLQNQLGGIEGQKNSLLDQIGATYGNVRQQAQDTLAKNLGALEQGKGTVKQGYADLRTEQSRLLGDTELRNRNLARSLGSLNSSYYENLQNKANATTQANVSKIGQQEQSQLDNIGQEIINQNTDANTKIQGLNETEAAAKSDILGKYQSAVNQVNDLLRFNDKGKLDAVQAINNQAQNALDNITLTMQAYRQQAGGVANPIKSAQDQVNLLSSINKSGLVPVSQQYSDAYSKATSLLQSGQATLDQVVGYLKGIDPRLAAEFQLNTQQNGSTGGVNLPLIGNLGGHPAYTTSVPQSSPILDQLFSRR